MANRYLLESLLSIPLAAYLSVELRDGTVILCLTIGQTAILFSTETAQFYIPTSNAQRFQFLHILTYTYYFLFSFNNSHIFLMFGGRHLSCFQSEAVTNNADKRMLMPIS